MKKTILISIILTAELFVPSFVQAQGTIYISNLGQTPTGGAAIGSDSWIAQTFFTGTNSSGYILNSFQLLMDAASGSPSGFSVLLYSSQGNVAPGSSLGGLNGSINPSAGGLYTYTTSGLRLSPSTFYFVVVTATMPIAQGAYNWSAANSFTRDSSNWWIIDDSYYSSANGSS